MDISIQDNLRKINSQLSVYDCIAMAFLAAVLLATSAFLHHKQTLARLPVVYRESTQSRQVLGATSDSRPFGSKNGTTYTYSWCSGSSNIKPANKIFFASSEVAEASGRRLSKLCQK